MHFSLMILCMIAFLEYVLIVHYPHQLILTLFYQIIPDMAGVYTKFSGRLSEEPFP